jgi:hypothetical protein
MFPDMLSATYRARIAQITDCDQICPLVLARASEALHVFLLFNLPYFAPQLLKQRCAVSCQAKAEQSEEGPNACE